MIRCPRCSTMVESDALYCDSCGSPVAPDTVRSYLIGRDPEADLVLDVPTVSARHLSVSPCGDSLRISDLGSSNGTFVNGFGRRVAGPTVVGPRDVLFLGSYRLPVSFIRESLGLVAGLKKTHVTAFVGEKSLLLGRAEDCDVVLPYPQVSARHARLTRFADGSYEVEDLGSTNGTFVDGVRVTRSVVLEGARLTLGSIPVVLKRGGLIENRPLRGTVRLDLIGVNRVVCHRVTGKPFALLDDVNLSIYPSEFIGLMGSSGAGKTTLMLAMNGYEPPDCGRILVNGEDLFANFDRFRGLIGYVPQDDILHKELTVREALYFSAKLRLPLDTTDAEIESRIQQTLHDLKLEDQADQVIGSVEDKVLSGGQRKRVNLGMELITDPEILFLDEPTSGLSSKDTEDVISVLRTLADQGRTIVLTIHQPSPDVYRRLDHVLLLVRGGRVAFFGPPEPDSFEYLNVPDRSPDRVISELEKRKPEDWPDVFKASRQYQMYVQGRLGSSAQSNGGPGLVKRQKPVSISHQAVTLLRRYSTVKLRDKANLGLLALQAPVVGLMTGLLFQDTQNRASPLFVLVIAAIFFGCFNACREIVSERAIFRRERMVNLRIVPYVFSKMSLLAGVDLIQVFVMFLIAGTLVGFDGAFLDGFVLLSLVAVASTTMGLLLSSLVKSAEAAMAIVPMILIPQIMFAGTIAPLDEDWKAVVAAPMASRWATEALLDVEYRGMASVETEWSSEEERAIKASERDARAELFKTNAMDQFHLTSGRFQTDVLVLIAFMVLFLGAACWILAARTQVGRR